MIYYKPSGLPLHGLEKFDLHVHSKYSFDSISSPRAIAEHAARHGLKGFALSDHDSFEGTREARAEAKKKGLVFIPAMEITTEYGHVLCLFIDSEIRSRDFHEVKDEVKEQGGIACLAHPFRRGHPAKTLPFVEILNGRTSLDKNIKALQLAKKEKLLFTAGSDAHWLDEIATSFTITTAASGEELRKALLKRQCGAGWTGDKGFANGIYHNATRAVKYSRKILHHIGLKRH